MCRSVPHTEATLTLTRTSVGPKAGIFTSRISVPGLASAFTTASIVSAIKARILRHAEFPAKLLAPERGHVGRVRHSFYKRTILPHRSEAALLLKLEHVRTSSTH